MTETYLTPEAQARVQIDAMLESAGWVAQDANAVNLAAAQGVAVREFVLAPGHGRADYLLFVDSHAVGALEAKKEGETLTGVAWQTAKYVDGIPDDIPTAIEGALPFVYQSTGTETRFTNTLDPEPTSRDVFWFHRPETLAGWLEEAQRHVGQATLRHRLQHLPPLDATGLWPAQVRAIRNLEESLTANRPRALIQMATGAGKTYTAANIAYRLVKHADARRILFLVDRANLGRQTLKEFQGFTVPDVNRKCTELFNVQHLAGSGLDRVSRVTISTIQRLYSTLRGEELEPELDEVSGYDVAPSAPVSVEYNPDIPPETFDVLIVDECHRSIFGVWRQVIDYFDAFVIGLTATPNKQAFGFFNQNLVMEYTHDQAVADEVNVDFDVYRIRSAITEGGSTVEAGIVTQFRDRKTRARRWEQLDEDVTYGAEQLDRAVVARDQIRTVLEAFRDRLFTEIFPGRTEVPKTLIFAKDDAHADDVVQLLREVFGKGDEFAAKITYKATGRRADELIKSFRNSYNPRIAVTVDMIATGTDVKPLECVFFMRSVKSRTYFEQMKGRGVRVIDAGDLKLVTRDAPAKDRFVLIDAVGVTETDLVDTQPLDREPTVPLERLMRRVSFGSRDPEVISTIASRIARIEKRLTAQERGELEQLAGVRLHDLARGMVEGLDPDRQLEAAREASGKGGAGRRRDRRGDEGAPRRGGGAAGDQPEAARAARRAAPLAGAADRRDLRGRGGRSPLLEGRRRPRPRDRLLLRAVRRGEPRRDHRPPDPLLTPVPGARHLRAGQGARERDRQAATAVDGGEALAGLRDARPLEGARLDPSDHHRPRLARPLRDPRRRPARRLPRACERALPRLAAPAGERRPRVHPGAARLARADPGHDRVVARHHARRFPVRAVRRARRTWQGGRAVRRPA